MHVPHKMVLAAQFGVFLLDSNDSVESLIYLRAALKPIKQYLVMELFFILKNQDIFGVSTTSCLLSCSAKDDGCAFYLFISVQTASNPKSRAVCQGRSGAPPLSALCGSPQS